MRDLRFLGTGTGPLILVTVVLADVVGISVRNLLSFEAGKDPATFASRSLIVVFAIWLVPYMLIGVIALISMILSIFLLGRAGALRDGVLSELASLQRWVSLDWQHSRQNTFRLLGA